jgi:predicted metallopeptidase
LIRYFKVQEEEERMRRIVRLLKMEHIDLNKVRVIGSTGSKSRAIARIWPIPRAVSYAFDLGTLYTIELIWERYYMLGDDDKDKVMIHELLHIPGKFSGGLRPHGKKVNQREVNKLFRQLKESKDLP